MALVTQTGMRLQLLDERGVERGDIGPAGRGHERPAIAERGQIGGRARLVDPPEPCERQHPRREQPRMADALRRQPIGHRDHRLGIARVQQRGDEPPARIGVAGIVMQRLGQPIARRHVPVHPHERLGLVRQRRAAVRIGRRERLRARRGLASQRGIARLVAREPRGCERQPARAIDRAPLRRGQHGNRLVERVELVKQPRQP